MSMKAYAIGRTARIIKPYAVTQRNGRNGTFESRMVMFSLATDRDYQQSVTHEDGSITQERHTDFFPCRATGPIADLFNKFCSATKKDENGNDKLVSRRLLVEGHFEKYSATRTETIQANVNGQTVQLQVNLPEDREILVVEKITFLDANPATQNQNSQATQATVVAQATPNNVIMQAAPVAPVNVMAQAPVVTQAPMAPVVDTISAEVAPF